MCVPEAVLYARLFRFISELICVTSSIHVDVQAIPFSISVRYSLHNPLLQFLQIPIASMSGWLKHFILICFYKSNFISYCCCDSLFNIPHTKAKMPCGLKCHFISYPTSHTKFKFIICGETSKSHKSFVTDILSFIHRCCWA